MLVGALNDLLETGGGGDTERVHSDPPLPLAAGVEQGCLETDLAIVFEILLYGNLKTS